MPGTHRHTPVNMQTLCTHFRSGAWDGNVKLLSRIFHPQIQTLGLRYATQHNPLSGGENELLIGVRQAHPTPGRAQELARVHGPVDQTLGRTEFPEHRDSDDATATTHEGVQTLEVHARSVMEHGQFC